MLQPVTTNANPENISVAGSRDGVIEKSSHEESTIESSKQNCMSTTDNEKNKESYYDARNSVKEMCWFYMNHNYCRYGRNCRFSHSRSDSAEFSGKSNSRNEARKVSNRKSGSKTRNLEQNGNFKGSIHYDGEDKTEVQNQVEKDGEDKTEVQNQVEKDGDSIRKRYSGTSANLDKCSNPCSNNMTRQRFDNFAHMPDKYENHPSVQTSHRPNAPFRQRNLYFYRSSNKSTSSDPPRIKIQSQNPCRYFLKGFCRQGDSCKFLHQANETLDTVGKNDTQTVTESVATEKNTSAAETSNKLQQQNCRSVPISRRLVKLQDMDKNDIQRLRDIEIQQLKKRFPAHEFIKNFPEEIFRMAFSPSDPDWSFAVSSVSLEIIFGKEYPREACVIKVLEAEKLPPILVRHLNKCISEWIREKHQSCVAMEKVELLFRPFLRWFDRNLEELFIVGLRKVKQDLLAKEAGIEFVPYDELPGAFPKVSAEAGVIGTAEYGKQDDCVNTFQECGGIGLSENAEPSTELKNMKSVQHVNNEKTQGCNTVQERDVDIISEVKTDYSSTSAEKENFSPDLLGMKFSPSKESESLTLANTSSDSFSIPKLGTQIKLLGLELGENAAAMVCTKIAATLQCSRCKTRHEINTPPKRKNSLSCIKCHQSIQVVFQPAILHQFSAVMGYLHLVDGQAVDVPLMECNFTVDCLNCSKQISINGIHYGQPRVTWCLFCNKKMSIYAQSVKFQQLQPALSIVNTGHKLTSTTKKDKKVIKDPAIQEGKPLPDCGTCKHYKKSYRWLRFPCCGKAYPCDVCHEEKETDHEMKYASRMICGFCAKEQPYAGSKPCISCSSNMTKKAGAHWEGGKGCRDKITMSREDNQKYTGMSKTISRKSQSQKPSK